MERFAEVLRKYDVPVLLSQVNGKDFARMAERLGVVQSSKKEDMQYLYEEYGHYDEAAAREDDKERELSHGAEKPASNAQEVNQILEEKRREGTYFRLDELEADFKYFEEKIIPELEEEVLTLIGQYLNAQKEENYGRDQDRNDDDSIPRTPETLSELFFPGSAEE